MKKSLLLYVSFIFLLFCTACEEEESPLLFSTESTSNPENIKIEYFSPDPSCQPKMYWIYANSNAGELTIKCTNANSIFFENHEGEISDEYICVTGQWKAKLTNSNIITLTFDEFDSNSIDESYSTAEGFNVVSQTKKEKVRTGIYVTRLTKSTDPI